MDYLRSSVFFRSRLSISFFGICYCARRLAEYNEGMTTQNTETRVTKDMFFSALDYVCNRGEDFAEAALESGAFFEELDAPVSDSLRRSLIDAALCFSQGLDFTAESVLRTAGLRGYALVRRARIANVDGNRWYFRTRDNDKESAERAAYAARGVA